MTPYELGILMHIHTRAACFEETSAPLRAETLGRFITLGVTALSKDMEHGDCLTDLGRAWLSAILSTRIPELAYIDQLGELIEPL